MMKNAFVFVSLMVLCFGMGAQTTWAVDLSKKTQPTIIKPSENKVKKYKVSDQKKYSVKVKKTKKVSLKKLEKQKKKDSEYKKNRGDQKKSKFDGKLEGQNVVVDSKDEKIETNVIPQDVKANSVSNLDAKKDSDPKKKVTQGEINKFSEPKGDKEAEVQVTPAGEN
ncbi:hypothetical protein MLD52_09725 [Puniceicoccaceae bacterium K14]|nr:hypothetical protein [Puniceicoccaceae bacterium K14]